ncbi:hypothetical protein L1D48_24545, partial [Vibrio chagasii]|nr:hypothetical protein [Vibrio chagasii]
MKYTKRSLVGLFTLLIIPTWGAQAANNAPYPFGEEFVYHTCPSGFDKQGMSCVKPASLKCNAGYSMSSNKQHCTKTITQNVTRVCPSGYSIRVTEGSKYPNALECKRWLTEKDYSQDRSKGVSYVYRYDDYFGGGHYEPEQWVFKWKGVTKYSCFEDNCYIPITANPHADGWLYSKGHRNGSGFNIVRKKIISKHKISVCPSGYAKSGSRCTKTVSKPVVKHCPSGSLNSSRCIVSPLRHSPIEETMATLYPRYSDDAAQQNAAAFRYLDNMFTLDPELGDIVSTMSSEGLSQDFSKLWANAEKSTADNAIEVVEGFAALQPDLPYLKEILFDVYYDRAAAEFILANRSIDQARIDWVNDADVSVAS